MWLRFATAAREMCHNQRQIHSHTQNQAGVGGLFKSVWISLDVAHHKLHLNKKTTLLMFTKIYCIYLLHKNQRIIQNSSFLRI